MARKTITFEVSEPIGEAREKMLGEWGEGMAAIGVGPSGIGEEGCNYVGYFRSWWVYAICVLFFPVGLLALLIDKSKDFIQVELFAADNGGTRVEVVGVARRKVWRLVNRWASASA